MSVAIEVSGLVKDYGAVHAVRGIDFAVGEGEMFGFLGPNGAGKSTTIKILCTLADPTAGTATRRRSDVVPERSLVRRSIGLVFQEPTLDHYLTARAEPVASTASCTASPGPVRDGGSTRCSRWSASPTAATTWSRPSPAA